MTFKLKVVFLPVVFLPFAGCAGTATPIVAGAYDHVGIVASADPQTQGANLSVGYKGGKIAILPVENRKGQKIGLTASDGREDTYSIFTQLGVEAKGGSGGAVVVEQVLAVGPAADAWVKNATPIPTIVTTAPPAAAPPAQQ